MAPRIKHYFVAERTKDAVVVHLFTKRVDASEVWEQRPRGAQGARGETVDPLGLLGRLKKRWGRSHGAIIAP
jgi:hypothetical protein